MMRTGALVSRRTVLAAGVALVTAGCVGTVDSSAGTELVWVTGGITAADLAPALEVVKLWNALHPNGPTIRVEGLAQSTNEQRHVLALELNAGLKNFDLFNLDVSWLPEFAQRGWLVDLQELRPDFARALMPGPMQTAVWNETLWAAPVITDAGILYYRSDLIDKPPGTWEELIHVGRRVGEQNGIAPFVAADGAPSEGLVVQYLEYFWGLGGEVFDQDGRSVLFQLDKAAQAVEFMRTAFREGVYAPGFDTMSGEDARATFQSGEAVFLRSWPYAYQLMNGGDPDSQVAGKIGIAPLPTFNGHRPVAALGGHNLAVSPFSRNIPAATEFVKFATTSWDVQLKRIQHTLAPTLKAAYDSLAADPMVALLAKVLPTAKPRPAIPEWAAVSAEMQQQVFAAYTGMREPKAAVKELRDFLVATADGG